MSFARKYLMDKATWPIFGVIAGGASLIVVFGYRGLKAPDVLLSKHERRHGEIPSGEYAMQHTMSGPRGSKRVAASPVGKLTHEVPDTNKSS